MKIQIITDKGRIVFENQGNQVIEPHSAMSQEIRQAMQRAIDEDVEDARNARNAKRHDSCWKEVKTEVAPRLVHGCDHGVDGQILLRRGRIELIWRKGSMQWAGRGNQEYEPAHLELYTGTDNDGSWPRYKTLQRGGRLTKRVIEQHANAIKEAFDVCELPDIKKGTTYVYRETRS
jgi:hypothetical protein